MSQSLFDANFKNFENYFNQNKHRRWDEWLILIDEKDRLDGKQGYVGRLQHPQNKSLSCMYKISKVDDNLVEHEYKILKGLEELSQYCPHFHRSYGIVPFESNLHMDHSPLEFNRDSKIVKRNMLLMQYIQSKSDLREFIEDDKVKDDYIINILKQVILAVFMAQEYRFTHYDLHTENILIRNCNPNMHLLYILDEQTQLLTPTYGYIPNIIDFGFSYCETETRELTCTLAHTKQGFTSTRFDPYADIKLFLISTVDDIQKESERKEMSKRMGNIIRNIFSGMNVQWGSGWDNSKLISPIRLVQELTRDYVRESVLFFKDDLWIDTVQLLIELPLNPMPYHELEKACKGFIEEFVRFEDRIASKTLLNYVLRLFVLRVKEFRASYLKEGEESEWAVLEIKKHFLSDYTALVNYHIPDINYEKMICSLLMFTQCIEGLYYDTLQKRYAEKDRQYELMRCKSLLDFYRVLDYSFPNKSPKPLTQKSSIFVMDHVRRQSKTIQLNTLKKEDLNLIEKMERAKQGDYIAKFIRNIYEATTET
jgi:hypothetical protein